MRKRDQIKETESENMVPLQMPQYDKNQYKFFYDLIGIWIFVFIAIAELH